MIDICNKLDSNLVIVLCVQKTLSQYLEYLAL